MIKPTEFAPGKTFGSGDLAPIDYLVGLAEGRIAPPKNLNIRTVQQQAASNAFRFHFAQYATRRADEWAKLGFKETLIDFPTLNARSKFWGDDQRAAFKNWEETDDIRNPIGERQGIDERLMLRELLRRTDMMVMLENHLDLVVRLHTPLPPSKIGGANQPSGRCRKRIGLRTERRRNRSPDPGRLRAGGLRRGLCAEPGQDALRRRGQQRSRRRSCRLRDCRSRWCFARSLVTRTSFSRRPPPTRRRRSGGCRRRRSDRSCPTRRP